ncbi:hypothetical protein PP590_gp65 [Pseudoalteromonas phage HS1]|nr:hypothetical protein PP589_gp03 [Pseudoalteromonas phage HS5]YP_010660222.1 hypothetical protein PP590_gp65 [Pseudoalteromonas phage HS1]
MKKCKKQKCVKLTLMIAMRYLKKTYD